MYVTSSQLTQKLLHQTGWCYLHDKKFPVTSSGKETVSSFNVFVYTKQKISMSEQRNNVVLTLNK